MDDRHLLVVTDESAALAACLRDDPGTTVGRYPSWTLADLGRHVGGIHRWVTEIVRQRSRERIGQPDVDVDDADVAGWIENGAGVLVDVLGQQPADQPVWVLGDDDGTVNFWRRRMAIETTLHRWDAQAALGVADPVADWLAIEAVDEALHVYLERRLRGEAVGGDGQRLRIDVGAGHAWTLQFLSDRVVVEPEPRTDAVDAVVRCGPLDAWLLLTGRRTGADLPVEGARELVDRCEHVVAMVPGPDVS